ncbi:MAG: Yip1 family protein [Chromatiaceae bacterium]|jgi:hypothetical protein
MLAKHFSHLIYQPKHSLEDADRQPARPLDIVMHVALLSLIPTLCGYYATAVIGWDLGAGEPFTIAQNKALYIAIACFVGFNVGVYAMGYGICWLSQTFDVKPKPMHCVELAVFTSVPLFLVGFSALYPVLYINVLLGLVAIAASVYLLYIGVPIFMHIPEDEGFVYSSWVVSLGMIMIVVFLGLSAFVFSWLS